MVTFTIINVVFSSFLYVNVCIVYISPCKWIHPFGGEGQRGKCKTYPPPFNVGIGGNCGPEGDASNNIATKNITFRRIKGTVAIRISNDEFSTNNRGFCIQNDGFCI